MRKWITFLETNRLAHLCLFKIYILGTIFFLISYTKSKVLVKPYATFHMFFYKLEYFFSQTSSLRIWKSPFFSKIGFGYCLGPPRRSFFRFEPLWVISLLSDHQLTPTERYPDTTRWVLFTISIQFLLGPIPRSQKT